MKNNNRLKRLPQVKFICSGTDCPRAGKCMAHDNYNRADEKQRADNPKPISEALRIPTERCFCPNYAVPRLKKSSIEQMFNRRRLEAQRNASGASVEEPEPGQKGRRAGMTDGMLTNGDGRDDTSSRPSLSKTVCCDCLEFMRSCADGEFDLAIVDPPYGIGKNWIKPTKTRGRRFEKSQYDNQRVGEEYFRELKRISKEQIIWGYNYYTEFLGSTNYLIIWDKKTSNNPKLHYSKCEIAYTSKRVPCNIVSLEWDGYRMGGERGVKKIHPHQKPVALYEWLLRNYAKPGDKIFDGHLGSGSSRIAAARLGFDFVGCEIDPFFYEAQERRFRDFSAQKELNFSQ